MSPELSIAPAAPAPTIHVADRGLAALVHAARAGDEAAWTALVARYDRTLRAIARSYRLGQADVDEVVQITWARLYRNIDRLREPQAIVGWLATTTRREAMGVLQRAVREHLSPDPAVAEAAGGDEPEAILLASDERAVLGQAIAGLPTRQRQLMTLIATQPDVAYEDISAALQMPVGSIGPIRARALARLRRDPELRAHCLCDAHLVSADA